MRQEKKLWEFIPASDFQAPSAPVNEAARGQSRRVWRWFEKHILRRGSENESDAKVQQSRLSSKSLEAASRVPDWHAAAQTLAQHLGEWLGSSQASGSGARALVGPAGCGVPAMLHTLAEVEQLKILAPPSSESLMGNVECHDAVLNSLDKSESEVLIIPQLERFYLRHTNGLELIRRLTERLLSRRRVLIGCNSWAWAFLDKAIGVEDLLGNPLALTPYDDQRLDAWFRSNYDLSQVEFRQSHNNEPVFPPCPDQDTREGEQSHKTSDLIKSLAAHARGNLGVALALWRQGLRTHDPESDASGPAEAAARSVYWVVSPSEFELPGLASELDDLHRFVLHALLLHAGLSLPTLMSLLPFPHEDVCGHVRELRHAGLISEQNGLDHVTLTAYPLVREHLVGEGFLSDAF